MDKILIKAKQNWFKVIIIVLLVMCYIKLGEVADNAFFTADIVDSSISRIRYSLDDIEVRLSNIQSDVQSIYYEIN